MTKKSIINFCMLLIISSTGITRGAGAESGNWKYYFEKGMIQFKGERYSFAMENFSKALEGKADLFEAANRMADIYMLKNMKREALELYTLSLRIDDRQADTHNRAGEINEFFGYYDEAFAHYRKSVEVDPQFLKARLNIVRHLVRRKEYTLAQEQFNICYERGKAEGEKYFDAATDEERRGRTGEAVRLYQVSLEKNPVMIESLFKLAEISRRTERVDEAVRYLEMIKEIKPDYEKAHVFLGHLYFAKRYARNRKRVLQLAIKNFEKAAELNPGNYETWNILSEVYRYTGDDVKADELFRKASELEKGPAK